MIELSYEPIEQTMLSPEEIRKRFHKVFGREMTPAERRCFFLDIDCPKNDITAP